MTATSTSIVAAFLSVGFVLTACTAKHPEREFWDSSTGIDGGLADVGEESVSCLDGESACEWPKSTLAYGAPPTADQISSEPKRLGDPEGHCPSDMRYVEGDYCDHDNQKCLKWRDNAEGERCLQWQVPDAEHPWKCLGKTKHIAVCIDTYEFPNKKGEKPRDWMSFYDCENACQDIGKRISTKSEWSMAALGRDNWPYPFGNGYTRGSHICNMDVKTHGVKVMKLRDPDSDQANLMRSYVAPSGSYPECHSQFGVYDMAGNLDEWTINETGKPYVSGLVGGHFTGVRNASRPMTTAHSPGFIWWESSCRCGKDPE
jgi:hypothetical protein